MFGDFRILGWVLRAKRVNFGLEGFGCSWHPRRSQTVRFQDGGSDCTLPEAPRYASTAHPQLELEIPRRLGQDPEPT